MENRGKIAISKQINNLSGNKKSSVIGKQLQLLPKNAIPENMCEYTLGINFTMQITFFNDKFFNNFREASIDRKDIFDVFRGNSSQGTIDIKAVDDARHTKGTMETMGSICEMAAILEDVRFVETSISTHYNHETPVLTMSCGNHTISKYGDVVYHVITGVFIPPIYHVNARYVIKNADGTMNAEVVFGIYIRKREEGIETPKISGIVLSDFADHHRIPWVEADESKTDSQQKEETQKKRKRSRDQVDEPSTSDTTTRSIKNQVISISRRWFK